ncbi:MAG: hypothetical protein JO247_05140 [Chloroflexi bacterium]|nr:hypothetical protein [Chloroflexota bacterium]
MAGAVLARAEAEAPALLVTPVPAVELVAAVLARGVTDDVLVVPVVFVPVVLVVPVEVEPLVALPMPLHGATVAEVALAGVPCVMATPATLQFRGTCSWMISTKLKPLPVEVLLALVVAVDVPPLAAAGRMSMNTICGPLLVTFTKLPAMPPLALLVDVPVVPVLVVVLEPERLLVLVEVEPVVAAALDVPVVVAGPAEALAPRPAELLVPVAPALLVTPRPAELLVPVVLPTPAALDVPVVAPVVPVEPVVVEPVVPIVARPLVPVAKEPCQLPCVRTCW